MPLKPVSMREWIVHSRPQLAATGFGLKQSIAATCDFFF